MRAKALRSTMADWIGRAAARRISFSMSRSLRFPGRRLTRSFDDIQMSVRSTGCLISNMRMATMLGRKRLPISVICFATVYFAGESKWSRTETVDGSPGTI
jgi:hypothetical protein